MFPPQKKSKEAICSVLRKNFRCESKPRININLVGFKRSFREAPTLHGAIIDLSGQSKAVPNPEAKSAGGAGISDTLGTIPLRPITPVARFLEAALRHSLLSALALCVFWHAGRFVTYLLMGHSAIAFFPANASGYLFWLPEFFMPWAGLIVLGRLYNNHRDHVLRDLAGSVRRGNEIQEISILGFAKISEARDSDTGNHIVRMSHYSRILAEEMGKLPEYSQYITRPYCEDLFISAPLHDIGKVGIRDNILKKQGKLTEDEFEMMKLHTIIGGDLLFELELKLKFRTFYSLSKEIAYHHHQRFDGTGYPNVLGSSKALFVETGIGRPLKGTEIPLSARIVALADVYDALASARCYKEAIPHEKAREMIISQSGLHFDPEVVKAFLRREDEILSIARRFTN